MKMREDKHTAPKWYMTAERRAYMKGYRRARYGLSLNREDFTFKRWPNAYGRGYNEGGAGQEPWEDYAT